MSTPLPMAKLPSSFRIGKEVKAHLSLLQNGPRKHGFHPSEMPRLCPVKFWFYDQAIEGLASGDPSVIQRSRSMVRAILDTVHDGVNPTRLPTHLEPDFRIGDAIHEMVQYYFGLRGYLWGKWECPWCHAVTTGPGTMPRWVEQDVNGKDIRNGAACVRCSGQNLRYSIRWLYVEPWAGNHAWGLEGHTDGILLYPWKGQTIPAILEVKSINENGYTGKYGDPLPKEDHRGQASQYVWAGREEYPDLLGDMQHIYFVYVNKNAIRDWKEFLVPADMNVVAALQGKMQTVHDARRVGEPPLHARACKEIESPQARGCPCVVECFGQEPPTNFFSSPKKNGAHQYEELPL